VRLTVLGCSGSVPGPNQPSSGYLLEHDGFRMMLDLGNGTLSVLQTYLDPFELDALVFSHLHSDHCADFSALTVLRRYHAFPPVDPFANRLDVYAPADAPVRLAMAYAANESERQTTDLTDVYNFHPHKPGTVHIGPFEVTAAQVFHPCEAYGFRITADGRTFAYTGDTGPGPALTELVDGVDFLLTEASWPESPNNPPDVHLSGVQAGQLATEAGAGRVVLTHIQPWIDKSVILAEAASTYAGDVSLAAQGLVYTI
jgi:ribonuclease BN (tRNA processing enzyme)